MRLIAITPEDDIKNEHQYIALLIAEGFVVHCRKPKKNAVDLAMYLRNVSPEFRHGISIHDHHELADDMSIKRLHFPENKRKELKSVKGKFSGYSISTSVHDKEELATKILENFSYVFVGPVFDSISKPGYEGNRDLQMLFDKPYNYSKIAIGGITPEKMSKIVKWGYDGAAFSGYLWENPEKMEQRIGKIKEVWLKDLTY